MGSVVESHQQPGQHGTRPRTTDARVHRKSASPQLRRVIEAERQAPRRKSDSPHIGMPMKKRAPLPVPEIRSTFTPRDMRVQFVKAFDKLEEESQKLEQVLHRFARTEKHQRDRLRTISPERDYENTIARFAEWKSALKDFDPESKLPKPMSILEARHVKWIQNCTNLQEMLAGWPEFPAKMRKAHKDSSLTLISAAVRHVPDKLHLVFEAALSSPYGKPYWYVMEDVIELLAMRLRAIGLEEVKALAAQRLAEMVARVLSSQRKGTVQFSQVTIRSILAALPTDVVEPWYRQLLEAECDLHPYTDVQFASRLAKSLPTKALSAQVLVRLQNANLLDINSPVAASVVTTILSFSKKDLEELDEHSATPADLFRDLHSSGLTPNVITYTTIIRGLCLKQDLRTALDVFEVMQQHGVQPNGWTYAILLHGCKMRSDWEAFADIAIQACNANVRETVVWNEVLHAVYACCLEHGRDTEPRRVVLYSMNSIYSRIFDAIPVRPFITGRLAEMGEHAGQQHWFPAPLKRLIDEIPPLPPQEVLQPGPDTLSIMILGLVRTLPLPYDLAVFYSQYRQMLRQGHPVAKLMVQEKCSFIHDIVLRHLLKWPGTLRVALDIIKDMMSDIAREPGSTTGMEGPSLNGADSVQQSEEGALASTRSPSESSRLPIPHPAPSIYTWTVLVHGFMGAKQPEDAEYIITLMRSNGIEPSLVTWNTLAAGYAKMQKIPEAVNAMRRLEAEGHEADDWTMRAFSYIGNKARAVELMEATVEANKVRKMAAEMQREEQEGAPVPDMWAVETQELAGQGPQKEAEDRWPHHDEEAREKHEDDFLDSELEARLDLGVDTYLDTDVLGNVDNLEPDRLADKISKRMYRSLLSHKGVIRKLRESAPVEESRDDTEAWRKVKEHGLSAMPESVRSTKAPDGGPQTALTKKPGEWTMFSDAELDAMGLRIQTDPRT